MQVERVIFCSQAGTFSERALQATRQPQYGYRGHACLDWCVQPVVRRLLPLSPSAAQGAESNTVCVILHLSKFLVILPQIGASVRSSSDGHRHSQSGQECTTW